MLVGCIRNKSEKTITQATTFSQRNKRDKNKRIIQ